MMPTARLKKVGEKGCPGGIRKSNPKSREGENPAKKKKRRADAGVNKVKENQRSHEEEGVRLNQQGGEQNREKIQSVNWKSADRLAPQVAPQSEKEKKSLKERPLSPRGFEEEGFRQMRPGQEDRPRCPYSLKGRRFPRLQKEKKMNPLPKTSPYFKGKGAEKGRATRAD